MKVWNTLEKVHRTVKWVNSNAVATPELARGTYYYVSWWLRFSTEHASLLYVSQVNICPSLLRVRDPHKEGYR